jgi:FixJ family two-component response regulator
MPEIQVVICVVDDDAMVRKAIARLLRAAGFTTETFASAETFLRSPHREVFTCLILDIDLPGQSGWELAHSFTASQSHVPIIFLTAREPRAADTCPSRAVTWLTKPCEADDLFAAIREALTQAGKDST